LKQSKLDGGDAKENTLDKAKDRMIHFVDGFGHEYKNFESTSKITKKQAMHDLAT